MDRSDELYVGTERGMHKVRTFRRREATEREDFTFPNAVGTAPRVRKTCELCCLMWFHLRLYINKADIMKHGSPKDVSGAVPSQNRSERKDTPKDAVHDSS